MKEWSNEFYLTASEVNAQEEMSLSRLVLLIIDTATDHANHLGVGYAHMMETNSSWVLSRLGIDIRRMPSVNRSYRITTWVVSLNRLYSERLFEIRDVDSGETVVWVHSVWMAIDMTTRRPTDLTIHKALSDVISERPFGGFCCGKLPPLPAGLDGMEYTFRVSDIDVNRHVTTRRYIDLITDLWPLDKYEHNRVARFEIAFKHEARYGEHSLTACQAVDNTTDVWDTEIRVDDTPCALARVHFTAR